MADHRADQRQDRGSADVSRDSTRARFDNNDDDRADHRSLERRNDHRSRDDRTIKQHREDDSEGRRLIDDSSRHRQEYESRRRHDDGPRDARERVRDDNDRHRQHSSGSRSRDEQERPAAAPSSSLEEGEEADELGSVHQPDRHQSGPSRTSSSGDGGAGRDIDRSRERSRDGDAAADNDEDGDGSRYRQEQHTSRSAGYKRSRDDVEHEEEAGDGAGSRDAGEGRPYDRQHRHHDRDDRDGDSHRHHHHDHRDRRKHDHRSRDRDRYHDRHDNRAGFSFTDGAAGAGNNIAGRGRWGDDDQRQHQHRRDEGRYQYNTSSSSAAEQDRDGGGITGSADRWRAREHGSRSASIEEDDPARRRHISGTTTSSSAGGSAPRPSGLNQGAAGPSGPGAAGPSAAAPMQRPSKPLDAVKAQLLLAARALGPGAGAASKSGAGASGSDLKVRTDRDRGQPGEDEEATGGSDRRPLQQRGGDDDDYRSGREFPLSSKSTGSAALAQRLHIRDEDEDDRGEAAAGSADVGGGGARGRWAGDQHDAKPRDRYGDSDGKNASQVEAARVARRRGFAPSDDDNQQQSSSSAARGYDRDEREPSQSVARFTDVDGDDGTSSVASSQSQASIARDTRSTALRGGAGVSASSLPGTPSHPGLAAEAASSSSSSLAAAGAGAGAAASKLPSWMTHNALVHGCRSVGCYKPIHAIDEGTYGKVWLAEDRETGERVALKQIKFDKIHANEGFPVTALRETNVLLSLRHPNIIRVREMVIGSTLDKVYMVMDFCPHNLRDFLERLPRGTYFTQSEVKCLVMQLLQGMAFMHEKWFIHRDLKTHNLLIDNEGRLAICDFGLARRYGHPLRPYTDTVVTLWYRSPELLLGQKTYGPAVDMWSVGCIFAEFLTKEPLFQTRNEAETVQQIFKLLGTPVDAAWPGWRELPNVRPLRASQRSYPAQQLRKALKLSNQSFAGGAFVSDQGIHLLQAMLTMDPSKRITAAEALQHPWFKESPPPADPRLLPAFPSAHDKNSNAGRHIITPEEALPHAGAGSAGVLYEE